MSVGDSIRKTLHFWHWHSRLLCEGLTADQLHRQTDTHPNHIKSLLGLTGAPPVDP